MLRSLFVFDDELYFAGFSDIKPAKFSISWQVVGYAYFKKHDYCTFLGIIVIEKISFSYSLRV